MSQNKLDQVEPDMEEVDFSVNQMLCESGKTLTYMYFPTAAIVSLLCATENGASSEVAVVGNNGALDMSLFLSGSDSSPTKPWCKVQAKAIGCVPKPKKWPLIATALC